MVRSYNEYMNLLDAAIIKNGKQALSNTEILSFISNNNLDKDWNITPREVQIDMNSIIKRHTKPVVPKPIRQYTPAKPKTVRTYSEYMSRLENLIKKSGSKRLSDQQVRDFIINNDLYKDWSINETEVKIDMNSILNKLNSPNINRNISHPHSSGGNKTQSNSTTEEQRRKRSTPEKRNIWSQEDEKIALAISEGINRYPEIIQDVNRLRNMLSDILPGRIREINILGFLVTMGILTEIKMGTLNDITKNRYVSRLESDYGTEVSIAERMVLIWFHSYGKNVLNKKIEC